MQDVCDDKLYNQFVSAESEHQDQLGLQNHKYRIWNTV